MCLCSRHVLPKISRKPIRVKKMLFGYPAGSGRMKTPVVLHEVKFVDGVCVIRSSVPWWKTLLKWANWTRGRNVPAMIHGEGVHSFDVGEDVYLEERQLVYEAEIPAWTPYWVSVDGTKYASSKLVIYDKEFKEEEV